MLCPNCLSAQYNPDRGCPICGYETKSATYEDSEEKGNYGHIKTQCPNCKTRQTFKVTSQEYPHPERSRVSSREEVWVANAECTKCGQVIEIDVDDY